MATMSMNKRMYQASDQVIHMKIPITFHEIVDEISRFTDLPRGEIEFRVWQQALEPGWNVVRDAENFGVTPFVFNERMEQLYHEGDGFIFDSLVFWSIPSRRRWIEHVRDRIILHAKSTGTEPANLRILMLGDGPGNDSLYLAALGMNVNYFDVPGSKTYEFALRRFEYYGYLGEHIHPVSSYETCLTEEYDVVVSLEVLEHLPDPVQAIADLRKMTKPHAIILITEDFGDLMGYLPTHLRTSANLLGKSPFLFAEHGLLLTWYSSDELFKPMEFVKVANIPRLNHWRFFTDYNIRSRYLSYYAGRVARFIDKLPYFSLARSSG